MTGLGTFMAHWNEMSEWVHKIAVEHGQWGEDYSDGLKIALMHTELSEALEGLRDGNPTSKKIPAYTKVEEEFADAVLRIMDFAANKGLDISGAMIAKIAYNENRPYKHGRKF